MTDRNLSGKIPSLHYSDGFDLDEPFWPNQTPDHDKRADRRVLRIDIPITYLLYDWQVTLLYRIHAVVVQFNDVVEGAPGRPNRCVYIVKNLLNLSAKIFLANQFSQFITSDLPRYIDYLPPGDFRDIGISESNRDPVGIEKTELWS